MTIETMRVTSDADAIAPDGSEVRLLVSARLGGMAHFRLAPGETSVAVHHRTVDEVWYVLEGVGEVWRNAVDASGAAAPVSAGTCLDIPVGVHFQFRASGSRALCVLGVTMPPWPGNGEAVRSVGIWTPTIEPGPGLAS